MTDPGIIFQRTHAGREEIHKKSHGLTQSERLVLIMVDGVSSCKEIRAKLPVLTDERFERALHKLQLKELVLEVFMPLEGLAPDELEQTVVDRFLQQDPMDPLTVILHDPDDELGMLSQMHKPAPPPVPMQADAESAPSEPAKPVDEVGRIPFQTTSRAAAEHEDFPTLVVPAPMPSTAVLPEPTLDAQDVMLADALSAELKAKWAARPAPAITRSEAVASNTTVPQLPRELSPFVAVHWGYWLIVSGLSFIVGYVLARLTS